MMSIEKNLIIAVLKLTKHGIALQELINKEARIPSNLAQRLLNRLQDEGLVYVRRGQAEVDSLNRLKLAVRAISLGADSEHVGSLLQWREFEGVAAAILERSNYVVSRNLRFKHAGRRWEMDIVACKKPLAVCIDCKHWRHGICPSALKNIVKEQIERAKAFAECMPNPATKIECASWDKVKIVPSVLSLVPSNVKFVDDVCVVPIFQLQDFLNQLPVYANSLKHFLVTTHNFENRLLRKP
jgi:Holliday junction resolvase-like predicted endonuclease